MFYRETLIYCQFLLHKRKHDQQYDVGNNNEFWINTFSKISEYLYFISTLKYVFNFEARKSNIPYSLDIHGAMFLSPRSYVYHRIEYFGTMKILEIILWELALG